MRTRHPPQTLPGDMAHTIHLELDLDLHREPIAGVLSSQNVHIRSFDGWMELASAIEDARNGASRDPRAHKRHITAQPAHVQEQALVDRPATQAAADRLVLIPRPVRAKRRV